MASFAEFSVLWNKWLDVINNAQDGQWKDPEGVWKGDIFRELMIEWQNLDESQDEAFVIAMLRNSASLRLEFEQDDEMGASDPI